MRYKSGRLILGGCKLSDLEVGPTASGVRYDAVTKTLYIDSKIGGNFRSFLSTASGYAVVGLKGGKPFIDVREGNIEVQKCIVSGKTAKL